MADNFGMPKPDEIRGDRYALYMDAETARIVSNACEFYARIYVGQFEEVRYLTVRPNGKDDPTFGERLDRCSDALLEARKAAFPELVGRGHSYGIGHFRDADTAWNVYQAIRYVMAWHDHPEGGNTVNFNKPMRCSDAPMPCCELLDAEVD